MKVITVTGYKGGIGKSTTAMHLADFFHDQGKVVLVDSDPNHTCLSWASRGEITFTVVDQRRATKSLAGADYVIIDTPARPESEDLKELAEGCDLLILPTLPDIISLEPTLRTASDLAGYNWRVLLTLVPPPPNREGELIKNNLEEGQIPVFNTLIRRSVLFAQAAMSGKSVRELKSPRAKSVWEDYQQLGREVLENLQ